MNQPYLSFLILLGFVAVNAAGLIVLSHLIAPHKPTPVKDAPYESGMPPLGSAHERFSVKFYLVAMLFIVFDIETVFLIPWGAIFFPGGGVAELGAGAGAGAVADGPGMGFLLVEMLVFMAVLAVGYVYVWKRGAFQWD
jgi:NADH-quinone oxidoreductase subunit A